MSKLAPIEIDPETFLRTHCEIEALPTLINQIQDILNSEDVSVGRVSELVAAEPTLAAQVLRIVNSAYYNFPREILDVKIAVAYIGINEVYRIILSLTALQALASPDIQLFSRLRDHSLFSALCTKHFTTRFEPLLPIGEVWTAGLLQNIGRLIYLKFFPDHFKMIVTIRDKKRCLIEDVETVLGLPKSSYFGSLLCDRWQLPEQVKKVCERHSFEDFLEARGEDSATSFIRMVSLGSLAATLCTDELEEETYNRIVDGIQTVVGITADEFTLLMGEVSELKEEVSRLSSL